MQKSSNVKPAQNNNEPTVEFGIILGCDIRFARHRRPTLNDLFWVSGAALTPLKSEKGWGSELGLLWQPQNIILRSAKISANAELTTYYRELDFPILWVPAGAVWRATNISGGGRYSGLQLSAQIHAQIQQSKFGIQTNFDRVKALVKQSSQGPEYQQIFVPLYNGNLAVSLHRPNNQFVLNTQFTGYRHVQTDNLDGLPAYALLNAAWRHKNLLQHKGISADLGIQLQNITQTVYYSMPGRPMPGRSVQFTLWVQTISKSHINKIK